MANELWRAEIIGTAAQGEQIINTFHYGNDISSPVAIGGNGMAQDVTAKLLDLLEACVGTTYLYRKTVVKCLAGYNVGVIGEDSARAGESGSRGSSDSNLQCVVLKRISAFAGRNKRGRIFLSPSIPADINADGSFVGNPAAFLALGDAMASALVLSTGPEIGTVFLPLVTSVNDGGTFSLIVGTPISPLCGVRRSRRVRLFN